MFLILGFTLYAIGATIMLLAYKFGSPSVLQPMMSFNNIFIIVLERFVLNEEVGLLVYVGIAIVFAGTLLIGGR